MGTNLDLHGASGRFVRTGKSGAVRGRYGGLLRNLEYQLFVKCGITIDEATLGP
jgi:hypothetical protein